MAISVVESARVKRRSRRPTHTFQIRHKPFVLQPFMIAPVIPGDTIDNILLQSSLVSDPIKNPLIGWWVEHYFFYVKHSDMTARDTLQAMMLDPSTSTTSLKDATGTAWTYTFDDGMDWVKMCLEPVVEHYFRNQDENWDTAHTLLDGLPMASVNMKTWMDSVTDLTAMPVGGDIEEDENFGQFDVKYAQWQFLRDNKLINMTYEDWLASYGVRPNLAGLHKPELLRYARNWTPPANTVDPTTGTPSSAVRSVVAERADKNIFCREPGFVFGVSCVRPKVYSKSQSGAAVGLMDDAYSWLPAIMRDTPEVSLKQSTANNGPLQGTTNTYITDIRDLLVYGDQFINFDLAATDANLVAIPNAALTNKRFVSSADVDALFSGTGKLIRQDGVVTLNIRSAESIDHT